MSTHGDAEAAWHDAVEGYRAHVEDRESMRAAAAGTGLSDQVRARYVAAVREFAATLADVGPWEVEPEHVTAWLSDVEDVRVTRERRSLLRAFYAWALEVGHVETAPLEVPPEWRELHRGWDTALQRFERHLASAPSATTGRPLATSTRRAHLIYLRRFARDVAAGPWEVDVDQASAWAAEQRLADDGQRKARLALQVFYAWAVATGRRSTSPVELPKEGLGSGWHPAVEGFMRDLAVSSLSPATQETYVRHVRWLASSVTAGPDTLEVHELQAWVDRQQWSVSTRRKVLVSLRSFYRYATATGLARWSPLAGLQSPEPTPRGPAQAETAPGWVEPLEAYMRWMRAAKLGEGTVGVRRWDVLKLSELASDPWQVTTRQLELWLSNPDWSPQSTRRARSSARSFFGWAVKDGRLERSPAADLRSVRCPRALPRPTSDDALAQALAGADERTRLILLLATLGGLRRAEIAALHTRDVTREHIHVEGKAGRHRLVSTHPLLWSEISVELERRRRGSHGSGFGGPFCSDAGYLFPSDLAPVPLSAAHVGKLGSQALPAHWTLHSLRHKFATGTYAAQRDLLAVQQLLGHSKPETTAVYAQVPDGALQTAVHSLTLPGAAAGW